MSRLITRHGSSRGQTLVEFALIVPIFVLLLVGLADLGRAVYAFNTISNASREGVRVGIVDQDCASIKNEAVRQSVSLGVTSADVDVYLWDPTAAKTGNFTSANQATHRRECSDPLGTTVGTTECPQSNTSATVPVGCVVEVDITYHYTAATPLIGNIVGVIDMRGMTREPTERTCDSRFLSAPATCQLP
jgi:Flp pilus assembly protein TadG